MSSGLAGLRHGQGYGRHSLHGICHSDTASNAFAPQFRDRVGLLKCVSAPDAVPALSAFWTSLSQSEQCSSCGTYDNKIEFVRTFSEAKLSIKRVAGREDWAMEVAALLSAAACSPQCSRIEISANLYLPYRTVAFLAEPFRVVADQGFCGPHVTSLTLRLQDKGLAPARHLRLTPQLAYDISRLFPGLTSLALTGTGWAGWKHEDYEVAQAAFAAFTPSHLPHLQRLDLEESLYPPETSAPASMAAHPQAARELTLVSSGSGGSGALVESQQEYQHHISAFFSHTATTACGGSSIWRGCSVGGAASPPLIPSLTQLTFIGPGIRLIVDCTLPLQLEALHLHKVRLHILPQPQPFFRAPGEQGACSCSMVVDELNWDRRTGRTVVHNFLAVQQLESLALLLAASAHAAAAEASEAAIATQTLCVHRLLNDGSANCWLRSPLVGRGGMRSSAPGLHAFAQQHRLEVEVACFSNGVARGWSELLLLTAAPVRSVEVRLGSVEMTRVLLVELGALPVDRLPYKVVVWVANWLRQDAGLAALVRACHPRLQGLLDVRHDRWQVWDRNRA